MTEVSNGFGGFSGLSPNWRQDRRIAIQHVEFFCCQPKENAEWRFASFGATSEQSAKSVESV
jgi:hypothetical protein